MGQPNQSSSPRFFDLGNFHTVMIGPANRGRSGDLRSPRHTRHPSRKSAHCRHQQRIRFGAGAAQSQPYGEFREHLYPRHPWFDLRVGVHQADVKPDGVVFRCSLNGRRLEVPAWMFDRSARAPGCGPLKPMSANRSYHGGSGIFARSISAASTRLTTLMSPWTWHRYVTTSSLSRVG
jgi:hypothetical protein